MVALEGAAVKAGGEVEFHLPFAIAACGIDLGFFAIVSFTTATFRTAMARWAKSKVENLTRMKSRHGQIRSRMDADGVDANTGWCYGSSTSRVLLLNKDGKY
jgi:hypothetical protein